MFSTTTGCPQRCASMGPTRRATMSGPPPGGDGTITFTGRDGYLAWAKAGIAAKAAAAAQKRRRSIMRVVMSVSWCVARNARVRAMMVLVGVVHPQEIHAVVAAVGRAHDGVDVELRRQLVGEE